ncbi:DUF4169 family protein [Pararhodospirillum oryzae]|uniref:DUF4169 domain-containing protein n=1 Tax=Pararhodospirillum oryzae TaxID=478448 RepID=A0A512HAA4_9PROT|nr:DUF4169 family protein [Pararhodospirillum oryzae]GEO82372.1 hypothetical protein ROR02_25030 [Pararhodospirillum oryzae]
MAEIINLRQARKARRREDKDREAALNRARFGQTGVEKKARAQEEARADRALDGHHRGQASGGGDTPDPLCDPPPAPRT